MELISKKELLELTNISYGQLYRWKRKNIIPEMWFIKKSVSTGQETFFPRKQMLERIEQIINLKDELSLDELANVFNPKASTATLSKDMLLSKKYVKAESVVIYEQMQGGIVETLDEFVLIGIKIIDDYVASGMLTYQEGKQLLDFVAQNQKHLNVEQLEILVIRRFGFSFIIGSVTPQSLLIDETDKVVVHLQMGQLQSELRLMTTMD